MYCNSCNIHRPKTTTEFHQTMVYYNWSIQVCYTYCCALSQLYSTSNFLIWQCPITTSLFITYCLSICVYKCVYKCKLLAAEQHDTGVVVKLLSLPACIVNWKIDGSNPLPGNKLPLDVFFITPCSSMVFCKSFNYQEMARLPVGEIKTQPLTIQVHVHSLKSSRA